MNSRNGEAHLWTAGAETLVVSVLQGSGASVTSVLLYKGAGAVPEAKAEAVLECPLERYGMASGGGTTLLVLEASTDLPEMPRLQHRELKWHSCSSY